MVCWKRRTELSLNRKETRWVGGELMACRGMGGVEERSEPSCLLQSQ